MVSKSCVILGLIPALTIDKDEVINDSRYGPILLSEGLGLQSFSKALKGLESPPQTILIIHFFSNDK